MNTRNLYYIQVNTICLLLLLIMYLNIKGSNGIARSRKRIFGYLTIVAAIMCASDIFAWASIGTSIAGAYYICHIANMVYFATITLSSYLWFFYVYECVHPEGYTKKFINIAAIPLCIMLLVILINPFTGLEFTVQKNPVAYARGQAVYIHWIISYGYMLLAFYFAVSAYVKTKSSTQKREYRPLITFFIWPIAAAILQVVFYGVTATQCGATLSIVTITLSSLQQEISTDDLTGLNNRNALKKRASDDIANSSVYLSVLLCDIDKFKTINDTMGHAIGDVALTIVSRALKDAAAETLPHSFICRYGGDEFVLVVREERDVDFSTFSNYVEQHLAEPEKAINGLVRLSLSYGTASGVCHNYEEFEQLIKKADKAMYKQKQAKSLARY